MPTEHERAESFLDPVAFQEILLGRHLWEKQREIVRSVHANLATTVKGCHASGKTFVASGLPLHWLIAFKRGKVFTTSPTLRQVKMFWAEIAAARKDSPPAAGLTEILPEPTTTELVLSEQRRALGASSAKGVNIQGMHGDDVLIIADEAPGISADIWDAIEGIRAGGRVHVLELGNPVVPSGHFFDGFHKGRAAYNTISISAFDTPNLQDEFTGKPLTMEELVELPEERMRYAPYPMLITRQWVRERYRVWGPTHPKFRSRVLAEFPTQSDYSVFSLEWIEAAKREPTESEMRMAERVGKIQVGIDVAGAGDDETTMTARVGGMILEQHAWDDPDPRGQVVKALGELKRNRKYPLFAVVVDVAGIGYNFALHLADQGFPIYGFNPGQRPLASDQYVNGKAEAYFVAREYFKDGLLSGLEDEECEAQLTTIQYRLTGRGLVEIESKEEARKRGIPSPDRAEGLIFAFMRVVLAEQTTVYGGMESMQISPI
jgi:phage terminase large subunit